MRAQPEQWLDSALRRSPAQRYFERKASQRLAVLAYHGIDDADRFARHMDHLRRTARPITLEAALDAFEGRSALPERAALITFDDGHRSVYDVAMPILGERGFPAVVFVIAGVIGSERPFWWTEVIDLANRGGTVAGLGDRSPQDLVRTLKRVPDQRRAEAIEALRRTASAEAAPVAQLTGAELRSLESAGIAIGNHTWSHPSLPRCSPDVVRREIVDAHESLRGILGHGPEAFAYPYGDADGTAAACLRGHGYRAAFLFDHHLSPTQPRDAFAVSRLRVNSTTTLDRFRMISSGFHPSLHRLRGGA